MVILRGTVVTPGTINNVGGTLVLETPTFSHDMFSSFGNQGVTAFGKYSYDNSNSTFIVSATTGAFGLIDGATFSNGTLSSPEQYTRTHPHALVNQLSTSPVQPNATLSNITLAAPMTVHQNAGLSINGSLTLSNAIIHLGGTSEQSSSREEASLFFQQSGLLARNWQHFLRFANSPALLCQRNTYHRLQASP